MTPDIDYERLIMSGVLIGALVLWGGIIAETTGLYSDGKIVATSALGVFIPAFTAAVIVLRVLLGPTGNEPSA